MDCPSFLDYQARRGKSREEAMTMWEKMIADGHDGEGEGAHRELWIQLNRKRFKDVVGYVDHHMEEGSKAVKDISEADRPCGRWLVVMMFV